MGLKKILLTGLFFLLNACSELQIVNPNPKIEVPELPGANQVRFQLEGSNAHKYQSTSDASARPPSFTNRTLEKSSNLAGSLGYSPADPFEIGVEVDPVHANGSLYGKYQFLGSTFSESQEGSISGMLHARFGGSSLTKSGDQKGVFGPGGYPWKGTIKGSFAAAGLSFGYRLNEQALAFAGGSYGNYGVSTQITQDAANGDAGGSYSDSSKGNAQTYGGGVVVRFNHIMLVLGGDYSIVKYDGVSTLYDTSYRVGFVFY